MRSARTRVGILVVLRPGGVLEEGVEEVAEVVVAGGERTLEEVDLAVRSPEVGGRRVDLQVGGHSQRVYLVLQLDLELRVLEQDPLLQQIFQPVLQHHSHLFLPSPACTTRTTCGNCSNCGRRVLFYHDQSGFFRLGGFLEPGWS